MQQWKRLGSHPISRLARIHLADDSSVRAGLVAKPCDWAFRSARYYEQGRSVGVPIRWIA
jgi:putative transposase